jgi:coenzyme PQQ synthesis protein D (PqqD)
MMKNDAPRGVREQMSVQRVGTEVLVYDEQRHRAFCLNASSATVWELADGERTVAEIAAVASVELQRAVSEEVVQYALEELRRDGLIEASTMVEEAQTVSRRELLQRLGVGGAMLLPAVAAIVAPTAAQAYSGCFDCSSSQSLRAAQAARASQLSRARSEQQFSGFSAPSSASNIYGNRNSDAGMLFPEPEIGPDGMPTE